MCIGNIDLGLDDQHDFDHWEVCGNVYYESDMTITKFLGDGSRITVVNAKWSDWPEIGNLVGFRGR